MWNFALFVPNPFFANSVALSSAAHSGAVINTVIRHHTGTMILVVTRIGQLLTATLVELSAPAAPATIPWPVSCREECANAGPWPSVGSVPPYGESSLTPIAGGRSLVGHPPAISGSSQAASRSSD